MAEQWIEAARALEVAGSSYALCERAKAGLIGSRARLLLIGSDRSENAEIPSKFWWAEGHEALNQNWASGDFSTWIDRSVEWKAFGATFALAGLLEMLPFERRAVTARSLSVAGNKDWISASEARKFAYSEGSVSPALAGSAIIEKAKFGFLTARAVLAEGGNHGALGVQVVGRLANGMFRIGFGRGSRAMIPVRKLGKRANLPVGVKPRMACDG